ncbi:MAG: cation-translocating P-type ATPase [Kiritimatiellae bacterium]|nr:cation-translocating P-type ATPase [Kiritimatiellia bacterium]
MKCCKAENRESTGSDGAIAPRGIVDRIQSVFESWPAVVLSAVCLGLSLWLGGGHSHGDCGGGGGMAAQSGGAWIHLALVPLFICGLPLLKEALVALFRDRQIKATLLISTAMIACVCIGQEFAAGEVAFIMALGEKLETMTLKRARKGLAKLVSLVPPTARKVITCPKCNAAGIFFREVPVAELAVGDLVEVLPGFAIPADGEVVKGETMVDQSSLTGESEPVEKKPGSEVYSGTINNFGTIQFKVTKIGADSSIQKLVRLVKEADSRKAPMQRIADKWAAILVPAALCLAILTFLGVWAAMDFHTALIRGVTVMVVFCPCALALATPTSVIAAIGQATKRGVIVKSGEALERMGKVSFACFDKTGTLQQGDRLRPGAKETIDALSRLGVRSLMLSGDRKEIAERFAAEAGIGDVRYGCLPEDKARTVEELQARGEVVLMAGDGINDSIALKVADVGIAMGGIGTDIAQEAADVSLVNDDLSSIAYLKRLSVSCVKTIKLNITISMCINFCAIVCSVLGALTPVTGALVHNLGSVLVILNGALLYDRKIK